MCLLKLFGNLQPSIGSVNTDGYVLCLHASCGGTLCDYKGTFMGFLASNLGGLFVF
jgi:hypothetical protein